MELKNKKILITGGSTGIGKAIAQSFIQKRASVIVFGLHKPDYKCEFYKVDVSKEEEIKNAIQKIKRVDIVVNNSGIAKVYDTKDTTTEILNETIDINFKGMFWLCKYVSPKLNNNGCVINISSIAGIKSFSGYAAYCASKSAVISFTQTLALELSDKRIRANVIAPGVIDTPIFLKMFHSEKEARKQLKSFVDYIPLKKPGKPKDIAHAAIFLAENEFVNGTVLIIDGGELLI